ncbi:MAG: histidinol-phosphate transaminase [Nitrospinota bacterium]
MAEAEHPVKEVLRKGIENLSAVAPLPDPGEVRRRSGQRVVRIGANENPLAPSTKAIEAAERALKEPNRYPDPLSLELRTAIGKKHGLTADHVFVGNGGDEVISVFSRVLLNEDDEVLIPSPAFGTYVVTAQVEGAKLVFSPLRDRAIDVDDVLRRLSPRTKLLYLCSPHNPGGTVLAPGDFDRVLGAVSARTVVVSDEAYRDFLEEGIPYADTIGRLRKGDPPHLLILKTLSKVYGLAGLRVGYVLGEPGLISYMLRAKEFFNVNRVAQAAALAALEDEEHYRKSREFIIGERKFLEAGLRERGIRHVPSQANFILIEIGGRADAVFEHLLDRGILARAGRGFGAPGTIRISVGTREENERVLEALGTDSQ